MRVRGDGRQGAESPLLAGGASIIVWMELMLEPSALWVLMTCASWVSTGSSCSTGSLYHIE